MKREDVKRNAKIRLTRDFNTPHGMFPIKAGTRGAVWNLEPSEFVDIEDYVMVMFNGMSYFCFVPISSLELVDILTPEQADVADAFIKGPHGNDE